jgi:hypothetical protein
MCNATESPNRTVKGGSDTPILFDRSLSHATGAAFKSLRKDASAGVDGLTFREYQKELGRNLLDLWERLRNRKYRAQPLRRVYIPKDDGKSERLIGKWINVGVIEEGRLLQTEEGVGQGQVISPLLANIYLHHVLDKWFEDEVKPRLKGKAFLIRYVDDAVIGFQNAQDAQKVLKVLDKRFSKYGLTLHPEKTRLLEYGRAALAKAERQGRAPDTFDFLGFTHLTERSRRGSYKTSVRTMKKRRKRALKKIAQWCKEHRHDPLAKQQGTLNEKLLGHYHYYGRSSNFRGLWKFFRAVRKTWRKWLSRRSRARHAMGNLQQASGPLSSAETADHTFLG